MGTQSGNGQTGRTLPQSTRHQRILTLAAKKPHASMESIAEEIPSATVDLVEHVLEEYGDPAEDNTGDKYNDEDPEADPVKPQANSNDDETSTVDQEPSLHPELKDGTADHESDHPPTDVSPEDMPESEQDVSNVDDLTKGQREVLRVVADQPDATQREIANRLGVSAPTVSNRVNAIEGFDWKHRKQAVETYRAQHSDEISNTQEAMATNETEPTKETDRLEERIDTLESQIEDDRTTTRQAIDLNPELLHKVVHACFKSETITEEEELELLKLFLSNEG